MKLSVIIPSYKDPLLVKTINSLLENSTLGDQLEVITVLDGYWPSFELVIDSRVRYVHLGKNVGMRRAINTGVTIAQGEFIMRADEHQMFGKAYDTILTERLEENWIVTPKRFCLDPIKWEIMDIPCVDYMKLKIQNCGNGIRKFSGVDWPERAKDRKDFKIDETMAMQGSCWVMRKSWWDKVIGELQNEGYGPHYQDSHEMVFKTWKAGGKLMVNKNTWHAHKHRSFPRTHNNGTPENPSNNEQCWTYSLQQWEDYYTKDIVPKWHI
jgi:GT2 family glycosyltransferase